MRGEKKGDNKKKTTLVLRVVRRKEVLKFQADPPVVKDILLQGKKVRGVEEKCSCLNSDTTK